MPSTYYTLLYHVIFSTKGRRRLIDTSCRNRLHEYIGGTISGLEGVPIAVGGVEDHVHLLFGLKPTHHLSDFMRELKKATSICASETMNLPEFKWQEGYAAFTVSPSMRETVQTYISKQEDHHRKKTFREELVEFLQKSGVEFDEQYLD